MPLKSRDFPTADREADAIEAAACKAIREGRAAKGWSQEALAEKARLDRSAVIRVERGQMGTLRTFVRLCRALGLDAREVIAHP